MDNRTDETIEMESQPLNSENKLESISYKVNNKKPKEKPTPIGLTKEELMKYASDPFWCKLRKILFASFWLLWLSMFVGAFLIIHYVPNCPATSKLKWYQKNSAGILDLQLFSNKFTNIIDNADTFSNIFPIRTFIFPSLFYSNNSAIQDHFKIKEEYGDFNEFSKMIKSLKINQEINAIMEFDIQVTSFQHDWYLKFEQNQDKYSYYYLKSKSSEDQIENYSKKQLKDGSYLILKNNKPVLNLMNQNVRNEIKSIFETWIRKGIKGFSILDAPFILYNDKKQSISKDINLNKILINEWMLEIKKLASDGILILQLNKQDNTQLNDYFVNQTTPLADIITNDILSTIGSNNNNPMNIKNDIENYVKLIDKINNSTEEASLWTGWIVDKKTVPPRSDNYVCLSNFIGHLASNGIPITRLSSDLIHINDYHLFFYKLKNIISGLNDYDYDYAKTYAKLNKLRNEFDDAILLGQTSFPLTTDAIFSMMKFNEEQGLIIISNLKQASTEIKLKLESKFPNLGEVVLTCSSEKKHWIGEIIRLDRPIDLKGEETIIVKFKFNI